MFLRTIHYLCKILENYFLRERHEGHSFLTKRPLAGFISLKNKNKMN